MKQKVINALTKNVGLKILAIVISFLLWLVVVNVDDPKQTRTFTSVVSVTNEDVLTQQGKLYEIKDGINTVSFRVTAKRSIIEKLSPSDFSAVADMNNLENEERIPVTLAARSYANSITISSKQNYLYVVLKDLKTERFVISAQTTGDLDSDLAVEEVTCSPTVVTVTGPEEVVSKIETVAAIANVAGVSSNFTENVIPKFLDKNGDSVDIKKLSLSVSTVGVSVKFVNTKTVDIAVKTSGELPAGLTLGSIKTDPSSVMIIGEATALNEVSNITIPESVINLSNLTGSFTTIVDISAYLPDGVTLSEGTSPKVTITVTMAGETASTITVPSSNIELRNVNSGQAATLDAEEVTVNVFGSEEALASLNAGHVKGYIDCSALGVGENQNAVLVFENPEGITIQNTQVTVTVIEDPNATAQESEESKEDKEDKDGQE